MIKQSLIVMTTSYSNDGSPGLTAEDENQIYNSFPTTILDEDSPRGAQPNEISTPLKFHQLNMIDYCKRVENTSKNPINCKRTTDQGEFDYEISGRHGIIGDIVGSGKTLSVLGLISDTKGVALNNNSYDRYRDTISGNFKSICVNYQKIIEELDTTLVVVPHTIFKQWSNTLSDQTTLNYLPVNTSKH